jgi:hypothetical protein
MRGIKVFNSLIQVTIMILTVFLQLNLKGISIKSIEHFPTNILKAYILMNWVQSTINTSNIEISLNNKSFLCTFQNQYFTLSSRQFILHTTSSWWLNTPSLQCGQCGYQQGGIIWNVIVDGSSPGICLRTGPLRDNTLQNMSLMSSSQSIRGRSCHMYISFIYN